MLILKAVSSRPEHGYGIARWIERMTNDALRVEEGSLYPALHRLERRKLLLAQWGLSENNRRAKFYRPTARGRAHLRAESGDWNRFVTAVALVLNT